MLPYSVATQSPHDRAHMTCPGVKSYSFRWEVVEGTLNLPLHSCAWIPFELTGSLSPSVYSVVVTIIPWYTSRKNNLMDRCTNRQIIYQWNDILMDKCIDGQVYRWAYVLMAVIMYRWEDVSMDRCISGQMCRWTAVSVSTC